MFCLTITVTTIDGINISKNLQKLTAKIEKNAFIKAVKRNFSRMQQEKFNTYLYCVKSSKFIFEYFIKLLNWLGFIECKGQANNNANNKEIIFALNWSVNVILMFALAYYTLFKSKV